jgi:hypothetical protein
MLTTETVAVKHAKFTLSVYNACAIAIDPDVGGCICWPHVLQNAEIPQQTRLSFATFPTRRRLPMSDAAIRWAVPSESTDGSSWTHDATLVPIAHPRSLHEIEAVRTAPSTREPRVAGRSRAPRGC